MRGFQQKRKHIKLSQLADTLRQVDGLSVIGRSKSSLSWDFDRSLAYLKEEGLHDHIGFKSFRARDKTLPLNSERHILEISNVLVRDLDIDLDNQSAWSSGDEWETIPIAKLHFEGCRFQCPSPNMWAIHFPWSGSFRFHRNEFRFPEGNQRGAWILVFESGSRASFVGNNFAGSIIQTRCVRSSVDDADSQLASMGDARTGSIVFHANRGVHEVSFQEGYTSIEIAGMNQIGKLQVDLVVDTDRTKRTTIFLGPREKIDPKFHNCLHHRALFLAMRQLAALNHDSRQLVVLERQLERVEYFLNKEQDIPSPLDYRVWAEYWQDRVLYGWRRWSSDFYRSWLRPLVLLVTGYMAINLAPVLLVDSFMMSHWIDFTLRPVGEIASYEESVARIMGHKYESVPAAIRASLKLLGLVEVAWIGVWGFAFAKAIKR